jgi:hypothetical protein
MIFDPQLTTDRVVARPVRYSESFTTSPIFTIFLPAMALDVNPLVSGILVRLDPPRDKRGNALKTVLLKGQAARAR